MTELEWRRIRVDWEELEEAFADSSSEHRYYFDRETGAVHFFSSYLDNEEEEEDERAITSENRYVLIPHAQRLVPFHELREFVATLEREPDRRTLESSLRAPEGYFRFEDAIAALPLVQSAFRRFCQERLPVRIKNWLADVSVEPLD
jgi:Uncharacterised protein family (UPF0158)